jgi:hypothetical protein
MSRALSKQITVAVANADGSAMPRINAKEIGDKYNARLERRGMKRRTFRNRFKTA